MEMTRSKNQCAESAGSPKIPQYRWNHSSKMVWRVYASVYQIVYHRLVKTWLAEKKNNWRFGWENHRKKHDHFPAMFDYQPWACSIWGGWDGPDDMMVISYFPIISNHIPWKRKSRKKSPPTKAKNPEKPSNPHPMSGLLLVAGLAKLICQGLAHLQRIGVAAHGIQGHTLLNKTSVADAWRFNVCCEGDTHTHTQHNGRIRKGGKVRRSCGNLRLNISFGGLL